MCWGGLPICVSIIATVVCPYFYHTQCMGNNSAPMIMFMSSLVKERDIMIVIKAIAEEHHKVAGDLLAVHGISNRHGGCPGVIGKTSALKTATETFLLHLINWWREGKSESVELQATKFIYAGVWKSNRVMYIKNRLQNQDVAYKNCKQRDVFIEDLLSSTYQWLILWECTQMSPPSCNAEGSTWRVSTQYGSNEVWLAEWWPRYHGTTNSAGQ